jgi:DNA-binding NtrC family response regulator
MQILMEHNWPGDVRELENAVGRAEALATDPATPLDVLQRNGSRTQAAAGLHVPLSS